MDGSTEFTTTAAANLATKIPLEIDGRRHYAKSELEQFENGEHPLPVL